MAGRARAPAARHVGTDTNSTRRTLFTRSPFFLIIPRNDGNHLVMRTYAFRVLIMLLAVSYIRSNQTGFVGCHQCCRMAHCPKL